MFTVLVAERSIRENDRISHLIKTSFSNDCSVHQFRSFRDLFRCLERIHADVILLDMSLPGASFSEQLHYLHEKAPSCIILPIADLNIFNTDIQPFDPSIMDYLLKPFSDAELLLTLEEALALCRKNISRNTMVPASDDIGITRIDIVRKKIQNYIELHYGEIISMQDVAHAMNYSDTHFCRLFKQCFQVNFSVYLNDFRIRKSRELLIGSNQTVKDVGFTCGYRDTSYFIRVFKRHTGMTPSDYRIHELTMTAKKYNKS